MLYLFFSYRLFNVMFRAGCDGVFESSAQHRNGTIQSPGWPSFYASNLRCTYHLIAAPNERVKLRFINFEVRSVPPK